MRIRSQLICGIVRGKQTIRTMSDEYDNKPTNDEILACDLPSAMYKWLQTNNIPVKITSNEYDTLDISFHSEEHATWVKLIWADQFA